MGDVLEPDGAAARIGWLKWICGGLAGAVAIMLSASVSHHLTLISVLSVEDVRRIVREETVTRSEMRGIVREEIRTVFTEVSSDRGMYAIEGRPAIGGLRASVDHLTNRVKQLEQRIGKEPK